MSRQSPLMQVTSFLQLGNGAFAQGDYAKALFYYQKGLEKACGDPDQLVDLHGNIGNVYGVTGRVQEAIAQYQKVVEIVRRQEDYARLGATYVNIGNLYADRQEPDQAIHFYKQAALLLERTARWEELTVLYSNLSLASLQREDPAQALDYAEKGMHLARQLKRPRLLADTSHRLAKAKGALGALDEALLLSRAAHSLYSQLRDESGCAAAVYHQVSLHEKAGNVEEALRCMEEVVAFDEKYGMPKLAENRARLSALRSRKNSTKFEPFS